MPRKAKEKDIEDESIKEVKSKKSTVKSKSPTVKKVETTAKKAVSKKVTNAKTAAKKETAKKTSTTENTEKKATTAKKTTATKSASTVKKSVATTKKAATKAVKTTKSTVTKNSTTKKAESTPKKTSKTAEKTTTTKKASTTKKSASAAKKNTTAKTTRKSSTSKAKRAVDIKIIEYYDLPYKYGNTIVKLLAQTPNTLFVYWEISNEDIDSFKAKYGEDFFNLTKPILIVHNLTLNKTTEVEVNDFANCWYLNTEEADCKYDIELARRFVNPPKKSEEYLYIAKSNDLSSPNDHIMFKKLTDIVVFKNYKTNEIIKENITSFKFLRDIYKFYQNMYKDELLKNPSSKF